MALNAGKRTAAVYGALLLMIGVMLPFMPVWLLARGFSIADVATALAAQSVVRVVAMPVITYWADRMAAPDRQANPKYGERAMGASGPINSARRSCSTS